MEMGTQAEGEVVGETWRPDWVLRMEAQGLGGWGCAGEKARGAAGLAGRRLG